MAAKIIKRLNFEHLKQICWESQSCLNETPDLVRSGVLCEREAISTLIAGVASQVGVDDHRIVQQVIGRAFQYDMAGIKHVAAVRNG